MFEEEFHGKLGADGDKYLSSIRKATGRLRLLIKSILDYSIIGYNKKKIIIDCNNLMEELLSDMDVFITENKAEIYFHMLPVVSGYAEIKSLFQNLISNAIKFKQRGVIPVINVMAKEEVDDWLFAVNDNGIGIEEKYLERIFTIFQRLHSQSDYEGTGIGLAHCKKIVELHGGKLWVHSKFGNGSTFYFTIPKNFI